MAIVSSAIATSIVFYLYKTIFSPDGGIWFFPTFTPVYIFVIVIFAINLVLSLVSYHRDRHLSYLLNWLTVFCCLLMLLAILLKINNPNG